MAIGDFTKSKAPDKARVPDPAGSRKARKQAAGAKTLATAQILSMNELDEAHAKLESFDGSQPVKEIDPNRVRASKFANRHADHFRSRAFAALREDIVLSEGNTVPIMVRPITDDPDADYEVIYGHRRLQACRDAGFDVLAVIQPATDHELYALMVRENNAREDLSAFEEAVSYKKALDEGLYPNQQRLADAIGVSQGRISQVLAITKVPNSIVELFSSPLNFQYRWAHDILGVMRERRPEVMAVAKSLKGQTGLTDRVILDALLMAPSPAPAVKMPITVAGKSVGSITADDKGLKVTLPQQSLSAEQVSNLKTAIERILNS